MRRVLATTPRCCSAIAIANKHQQSTTTTSKRLQTHRRQRKWATWNEVAQPFVEEFFRNVPRVACLQAGDTSMDGWICIGPCSSPPAHQPPWNVLYALSSGSDRGIQGEELQLLVTSDDEFVGGGEEGYKFTLARVSGIWHGMKACTVHVSMNGVVIWCALCSWVKSKSYFTNKSRFKYDSYLVLIPKRIYISPFNIPSRVPTLRNLSRIGV